MGSATLHLAQAYIICKITRPSKNTKFSSYPPVCVAEASLYLGDSHGVVGVRQGGVLVLVAAVAVIPAEGPVLMVGEMVQITLATVTGDNLE